MILFDTDQWSEIADALSKNKLRSFLTAFGIFWGVFMLVLLMGGGRGLQTLLSEQFAGFASNAGFAGTNTTSKPYKGLSEGRSWELTLQDIERVRTAVPQVDVVTGLNSTWGQTAAYQSRTVNATLQGITPDYHAIAPPSIKQGRSLNEVDLMQRRKVCVIGQRISESLFPGEKNICGRRIKVGESYFTIIGVDNRSGDGINIGGNAQTTVSIPLTTYQQMCRLGRQNQSHGLHRQARLPRERRAENGSTCAAPRPRHPPRRRAGRLPSQHRSHLQLMDNLFSGISALVWMIGVGTILSGAIGVSNIMMVTVRERTTEIGIRRAIGATPRAIMRQILSESMVLTLLAGMSGITLSVFILNTIETLLKSSGTGGSEMSFLISFWTALGSAILIAVIGLCAGITPAIRAMHIRPVEAMRSDE
jgi:putative ABC transport system permease protein